ncbi:MAG: thioredoxin-dependent thiol peroxidase [Cryomorphaceae bacterium]
MNKINEGEIAPDFSGKDQNGNTVSLDQFRGRKLVLFFYPKDDTPGCTAEACNLRDNYDVLLNKGIHVVGVSADSETKHQKFVNKYDLPFPLIADTEKAVINAFGVWGEKKFMGRVYDGIHRVTYVINEQGEVIKRFDKVKTKAHSEEILEALQMN